MNNKDKILYYGVWGSLIGVAIFYSFTYMRSITAPIMQSVFVSFVEPTNPNFSLLTFAFNFIWAVIAALVPAIITSLVIKFILKANSILYCAIPALIILLLSYWNFIEIFNFYSQYEELPPYIPELLNPIFLIGVFIGVYSLFEKYTAPNKAHQSTPQSGAPEL